MLIQTYIIVHTPHGNSRKQKLFEATGIRSLDSECVWTYLNITILLLNKFHCCTETFYSQLSKYTGTDDLVLTRTHWYKNYILLCQPSFHEGYWHSWETTVMAVMYRRFMHGVWLWEQMLAYSKTVDYTTQRLPIIFYSTMWYLGN